MSEVTDKFFGCDKCGCRELKHKQDVTTGGLSGCTISEEVYWECTKCGHRMNDYTRYANMED